MADINILNDIAKSLKNKDDLKLLQSLINRAVDLLCDPKINTYTKNVEITNIINVAMLLDKKNKLQLDNIKIDNSKIVEDEIKPLELNIVSSNSISEKDRISEIQKAIDIENGENHTS